MKDRAKSTDLNLLSIYLGRSLTVLIAAFVVVVAVSALLDRGGGARRNIIDVCVFAYGDEARYEPFRKLLSHATRRPVVVRDCHGELSSDYDLYIMPTAEYLGHAEALGIVALYEIGSSEKRRDSAVLVGRASDVPIDFPRLSADDVVFSSSFPVNSCLAQLAMLEAQGSLIPRQPSHLRFVPGGDDQSRIVLGVIHGKYRLGACRLSDLTALARKGVIQMDEITVVETTRALPEMLIAGRPAEADYYRRKLGAVNGLIEEINIPANQVDAVRLLKAYGIDGLAPMSEDRVSQVRELYDKYPVSPLAP